MASLNLVGETFGRLTVIVLVASRMKQRNWLCRCACGNEVCVTTDSLRSAHTRSCGCLMRDTARELKTTHGRTNTPEHKIWQGIIRRCYFPNDSHYRYYGGRGITLCPEWRRDFAAFYRAVGARPSPDHSIDRIDNDGGYEPGNVRWATRSEQALNRPYRGANRNDRTATERQRCTAALAALRHAVHAGRIPLPPNNAVFYVPDAQRPFFAAPVTRSELALIYAGKIDAPTCSDYSGSVYSKDGMERAMKRKAMANG